MSDSNIVLREYLKLKLSLGIHEVVFKKKDGSIRVLSATRDPGLIDQELYEKYMNPPPKSDGSIRKESTTSLPVYDIKDGWRSFSFDDLIGFGGLNKDEILKQAQSKIEG
ncbi:hypothetical protein ZZ1p0220 [Acinetobacter phage ZZ1]|uniref:Tail fibers protein n=1 Tax=Acinetobacter phage ZZ1 TaxID=1049283 RepID=I3WW35_9CAUD|nr:hypothetical protein ZZ1p0220 [Acinetobacter phage ZZ1]AFL47705.1 hypothetical protein ZZ1p0220 [Acinetobacter phage ZZ1]